MKLFGSLLLICLFYEPSGALASRRKGLLRDPYKNLSNDEQSWQGKWFPQAPNHLQPHKQYENNQIDTDDDDKSCDGNSNLLNIDFDPADEKHSYNYLCISSKRDEYTPDSRRIATLVEHFIPPTYKAPIICLNETIDYLEKPPPFGPYRQWAPQYGSYKYLPPQRWLHSLAEGAIVMLYHPCAFPGQVKDLEKIVKNCLYRHIITPSQDLTPERPLAVLAWGKYLKLSVVDEGMVVKFIKKNAKQGIIQENPSYLNSKTNLYTAGLLEEAHLITDLNDSELCGYKEM